MLIIRNLNLISVQSSTYLNRVPVTFNAQMKSAPSLKGAISGLAYLEKLSIIFLRSSFVICVNLLFP